MFQKDEAPDDLPLVSIRLQEVAPAAVEQFGDGSGYGGGIYDGGPQAAIRVDKLLARTGLATSVTDGLRKLRQNAVKIDGELQTSIVASVGVGAEFTLRAGKKMVKVSVES